MDPQEIVRRTREALEAGPPLRLAILFGSAATGRMRADSDVDVGILPEGELTLHDELLLQGALERTLGRTVDLVRLDRATTLLRWEAARSAVPLVARPDSAFARFRAEAAIEHADLRPNLEDAQARLRRRLREAIPTREPAS